MRYGLRVVDGTPGSEPVTRWDQHTSILILPTRYPKVFRTGCCVDISLRSLSLSLSLSFFLPSSPLPTQPSLLAPLFLSGVDRESGSGSWFDEDEPDSPLPPALQSPGGAGQTYRIFRNSSKDGGGSGAAKVDLPARVFNQTGFGVLARRKHRRRGTGNLAAVGGDAGDRVGLDSVESRSGSDGHQVAGDFYGGGRAATGFGSIDGVEGIEGAGGTSADDGLLELGCSLFEVPADVIATDPGGEPEAEQPGGQSQADSNPVG
jgi:hypothetical protein